MIRDFCFAFLCHLCTYPVKGNLLRVFCFLFVFFYCVLIICSFVYVYFHFVYQVVTLLREMHYLYPMLLFVPRCNFGCYIMYCSSLWVLFFYPKDSGVNARETDLEPPHRSHSCIYKLICLCCMFL